MWDMHVFCVGGVFVCVCVYTICSGLPNLPKSQVSEGDLRNQGVIVCLHFHPHSFREVGQESNRSLSFKLSALI